MTKRLLIVSLLCSVLGAIAPTSVAAERDETLRAINWVENPTNHTRRGSKGELGPYQFRSQTWRLHTKKPFSLAVVREHADEVAIKHYEWIKRGLREAGIEATPFNVALAWNSGLGAVVRGQVPTVSYHYAERVSNLVDTQRAHRAVAATAARPQPEHPAPRFTLAAATGESPALSFSVVEPKAARFALATEPHYEPVVLTDKTLPSTEPLPKLSLDNTATAFTFASATAAAAPRFALIQ
jgi:hypothetical protein